MSTLRACLLLFLAKLCFSRAFCVLDVKMAGSVFDAKDLELPPAEGQVEEEQKVEVSENIGVEETVALASETKARVYERC